MLPLLSQLKILGFLLRTRISKLTKLKAVQTPTF